MFINISRPRSKLTSAGKSVEVKSFVLNSGAITMQHYDYDVPVECRNHEWIHDTEIGYVSDIFYWSVLLNSPDFSIRRCPPTARGLRSAASSRFPTDSWRRYRIHRSLGAEISTQYLLARINRSRLTCMRQNFYNTCM